jgi:hypothetical protein
MSVRDSDTSHRRTWIQGGVVSCEEGGEDNDTPSDQVVGAPVLWQSPIVCHPHCHLSLYIVAHVVEYS